MPPKDQPQEEKYELSENTGKSFEWVPGAPPVFEDFTHGKIDIRTISAEKAAELVKDGCPHLIEKSNAPKAKALPAA